MTTSAKNHMQFVANGRKRLESVAGEWYIHRSAWRDYAATFQISHQQRPYLSVRTGQITYQNKRRGVQVLIESIKYLLPNKFPDLSCVCPAHLHPRFILQ